MSDIVQKYSFATNGFYRSDYHEDASLPGDAVLVTEEERVELQAGQSAQKVIVKDGDGRPVLSDPPGPTDAEMMGRERRWRDAVFLLVAGGRDRHRDQLEIEVSTTISEVQFKELLVYMQALRDWPQSPDFPDSQHRPPAPEWIAEQAQ